MGLEVYLTLPGSREALHGAGSVRDKKTHDETVLRYKLNNWISWRAPSELDAMSWHLPAIVEDTGSMVKSSSLGPREPPGGVLDF